VLSFVFTGALENPSTNSKFVDGRNEVKPSYYAKINATITRDVCGDNYKIDL
jgi:hypothetical protein